jgi:hypothetical protein
MSAAADEDWQSITNPLAREDRRRYEGDAWNETTEQETTRADHLSDDQTP